MSKTEAKPMIQWICTFLNYGVREEMNVWAIDFEGAYSAWKDITSDPKLKKIELISIKLKE